MIFWFHLTILLLVGIVLGYELWLSGKKEFLGPVVGLLILFVFHCMYWGEACTTCNLNSVTCLTELVVFWFLVGWGLWEVYKERSAK